MDNSNSSNKPDRKARITEFSCPEDFFIPSKNVESKLNLDVLSILIERAQSVVQLLISDDIAGNHEDFSAKHRYIMGAIFTLEGQLRQINQVFDHHYKGNSVNVNQEKNHE